VYGCKIRKPTCLVRLQPSQQRAYASNAPFLSHPHCRLPSRSGDDPPVLQPILAREGPSHLHRHLDTCEEFGQVRHGVQAAVDLGKSVGAKGVERGLDSFVAGLVGGYWVFGERTAVSPKA
jgi:hypothetical protein